MGALPPPEYGAFNQVRDAPTRLISPFHLLSTQPEYLHHPDLNNSTAANMSTQYRIGKSPLRSLEVFIGLRLRRRLLRAPRTMSNGISPLTSPRGLEHQPRRLPGHGLQGQRGQDPQWRPALRHLGRL